MLDGKDKCPDDVFYNLDATHAISCADAKRCTVRSALAVRSSWFCYPLYALLPAFSAPYGGSAEPHEPKPAFLAALARASLSLSARLY